MIKNRKLSLAALLLAAVMLTVSCTAFADEPMTDYTSENLTFSFGGGEFYRIADSNGVPTYCSTPSIAADSRAFLVLEQDVGMDMSTLGSSVLETMLSTVIQNQGGENLKSETITAATGVEGLKFSYVQANTTLKMTAYGLIVPVGNSILIVFYTGVNADDGEARIDAVANSLKLLK